MLHALIAASMVGQPANVAPVYLPVPVISVVTDIIDRSSNLTDSEKGWLIGWMWDHYDSVPRLREWVPAATARHWEWAAQCHADFEQRLTVNMYRNFNDAAAYRAGFDAEWERNLWCMVPHGGGGTFQPLMSYGTVIIWSWSIKCADAKTTQLMACRDHFAQGTPEYTACVTAAFDDYLLCLGIMGPMPR